MAAKLRLDAELVRQGFFRTSDEAMRAVLAGEVFGRSRRFASPGEQVRQGIELHVRARRSFVSRGGEKLEHAIREFGVDVAGLRCLDVGCSTGGFTDCLLRHGAASVLAVDVGYAQFNWELRHDARVELMERTNIVDVPALGRAGTIDLAVCDVSFTSVRTVLDAVCELLTPVGSFLTLVKPQFECPRELVGEGGVVRDEVARLKAVAAVSEAFESSGLAVRGVCQSPITGHKGNVEYLLLGVHGSE